MYFVVLSMIVYNTGFTGVRPWQIFSAAGGFVLIFVFVNYEDSVFKMDSVVKAIIASCKDIMGVLLTITGAFSDIMSYIRLWAMALAGASIATTVNSFAIPMFGDSVLLAFGVLLFAFGHVFNMVLNAMSFLVHGVRLNTLEFSSHMGLSWSGFAYKPFAKR
jgi:V/A-type H+-transporting ATPase subunit I